MKIRLTVLLLIMLATFTAKSQIYVTTPYEYAFGVTAGTTFSSVNFNPKVTQGSLPGMTFGVVGRLNMGKMFGLQLECNYVQQGWKEKYEDYPDLKYDHTLNYLQIPFYLHVQFGSDRVKGFINAGPQLGYFLSESESTNFDTSNAPHNRTRSQYNYPVDTKFEWGISGGPGIEFRTGIGYFLAEGRFFYSFGDIHPTQRKDKFAKASSQVITAKITYLIPVKKK